MATAVNGNNDLTNGTLKDSSIKHSKKRKIHTDVNGSETSKTNGHHIENANSQNGSKSAKYEPIKECGPVDLVDVLVKRHSLVG